jgi:hypothetical protein
MGLAERVRDACADLLPGRPGTDLEIQAATASASRGRSLHDALRIAQRDIAQGSADDPPTRVAWR